MVSDKAREMFIANIMPHLDDAFSLARWLTGNRADAEDVVQDACLRALQAVEALRGDHPRAWLLAIVRNASFTWIAKNRPKDLVLRDDIEAAAGAALDCSGSAANPESDLIARASAAELEAAILELPTIFREVIVMRDINGLNYRAIAEAIGAPTGTVMSRLARGRALLIAKLGGRG